MLFFKPSDTKFFIMINDKPLLSKEVLAMINIDKYFMYENIITLPIKYNENQIYKIHNIVGDDIKKSTFLSNYIGTIPPMNHNERLLLSFKNEMNLFFKVIKDCIELKNDELYSIFIMDHNVVYITQTACSIKSVKDFQITDDIVYYSQKEQPISFIINDNFHNNILKLPNIKSSHIKILPNDIFSNQHYRFNIGHMIFILNNEIIDTEVIVDKNHYRQDDDELFNIFIINKKLCFITKFY
jgi:hypothetical protein